MIRNRTLLLRAVAIAVVLVLVLPLVAAAQGVSFTVYPLENVKMRSGPGTENGIITVIPYSTPLTALGRSADETWLYVDYNGTKGWVYTLLMDLEGYVPDLPVIDAAGSPGAPPPAPPTDQPSNPPSNSPPPSGPSGVPTIYTTATMKLRAGAGTTYAELGRIPYNTTVPVSARSADSQWVLVNYNGQRGWVAAWLVTVNGDINSLPVSNEVLPGGAPTPAPAPPTGGVLPPPAPGGFELGGQTHSLDHPGEMHNAGMTWVKFQHKWGPGQSPNDLAGRIAQAHANGFRVLLSIPGGEYPSSIDYNAYVQFVAGVAALGADGIEIWNEMNLDREWPAGQINPANYVNLMLAPAYRAIKAANPATMVISGALAPTGVNNGYSVWSDDQYVAGMAGAGAANYMDCVGVHHNAGATSPDAVSGHPADGGAHHYSWYFKPTFNVYAGAFPRTKLCFTELGYVSGEGWGSLPANFWWGGGNTVGEQSEWLARAVTISRQTGKVRLLIVFNVDFTQWGDDPQAGYAIIRPGGGCPACDALRAAMQ